LNIYSPEGRVGLEQHNSHQRISCRKSKQKILRLYQISKHGFSTLFSVFDSDRLGSCLFLEAYRSAELKSVLSWSKLTAAHRFGMRLSLNRGRRSRFMYGLGVLEHTYGTKAQLAGN